MSEPGEFSLLDLFREEVRSHTAALGEGLLELETESSNPQRIESLMRAAHSIKGAARIVGVDAAVGLAHVMEDAFVAAHNGRIHLTPADIDVLLQGVDLLTELSQITQSTVDEWGRWHQDALGSLVEQIQGIAAGKTPKNPHPAAPSPKEEDPVGWVESSRPTGGLVGLADSTHPTPQPPWERGLAGEGASRPTIVLPGEPIVPGEEHPLFDMFREEVRAQTAVLLAGVGTLEQAQAVEIEPWMRAAHSIKGAARLAGVSEAADLAGALEDAFIAVQQGLRLHGGDADTLLQALAVFADLTGLTPEDVDGWRKKHEEAIREVKSRLEKARERPVSLAEPAMHLVVAQTPAARMPVGPVAVLEQPAPTLPALPGLAGEEAAKPTAMESSEAVVRVTAESLNRLMSLAGESLVQARWLQPFSTALLKLKKQQDHLAGLLDGVAQALSARPSAVRAVAASTREPVGRQLDQLAGMIEETRKQASMCRQVLAERMGEFDDHASQAEDLNSRLYREVIVSRMRPFADGAHGFPRLVRDMARRLERQVRLEIDGLTTEVDRDILEKLEAPLTHLLRNAVDHGIEPPEARAAQGKPEQGLIRLEVRHRAGMLAITVSDDGGGIDAKKLQRKIVERGLTTADMAAAMGEAELLEFLFLPGFSTAASLTEYSGRGVGLDVVQTTIRKVGGSVRVTTKLGFGSTFHLQLPITLSVLRAVLVDIAGEPYAFPHNRIDRLLRIPRSGIHSLEHRQYITVDGQNVGLVVAAQMFDMDAAACAREPGDELPVLLMSDDSGPYGLIVEVFRGEQDLVVRPLDPRLGKAPNISAAAILDDGAPVLIVDVEDLIRSMDHFIQSGTLRRCEAKDQDTKRRKRVLVVDDSITVREVERQLLRNEGYDVAAAVDGQDGWNQLRASRFDLVVSDVDMPRMSGLELVKLIRDHEALKDVPIIIVSYKDREEDRLRGLDLGANFYLTKSSFHDNTFLRAVADLIGEAT